MLRRGQTEGSSVPLAEVEHIDCEGAAEGIDSEEATGALPEPPDQLPAGWPGVPIWSFTGPTFSQPPVPYPASTLQAVHVTVPAPTFSVAGCLDTTSVASRDRDEPPEASPGTERHFTDRRLARMLARGTVPCAHSERCVREIIACETLPLCGECLDEDPGHLLLACPGCLPVEDAIFTGSDSNSPLRTVSATPSPESSVTPTSSQPSLEFGSTTVSDVDTFSMTHSSGASTPRVSASPPNYPDEPPGPEASPSVCRTRSDRQ